MDVLLLTAEASTLVSTLYTTVIQYPTLACLFIVLAANVQTPQAVALWNAYHPAIFSAFLAPVLYSRRLAVETWFICRYAAEDSLETVVSILNGVVGTLFSLPRDSSQLYVRSAPLVVWDILQIVTGFVLFLLCWSEGRLFERSKALGRVYLLAILQAFTWAITGLNALETSAVVWTSIVTCSAATAMWIAGKSATVSGVSCFMAAILACYYIIAGPKLGDRSETLTPARFEVQDEVEDSTPSGVPAPGLDHCGTIDTGAECEIHGRPFVEDQTDTEPERPLDLDCFPLGTRRKPADIVTPGYSSSDTRERLKPLSPACTGFGFGHRRRRHGTVSPRAPRAVQSFKDRRSCLARGAPRPIQLQRSPMKRHAHVEEYESPRVVLTPASPPMSGSRLQPPGSEVALQGSQRTRRIVKIEVRNEDISLISPKFRTTTSPSPRREPPSHRMASPNRSCLAGSSEGARLLSPQQVPASRPEPSPTLSPTKDSNLSPVSDHVLQFKFETTDMTPRYQYLAVFLLDRNPWKLDVITLNNLVGFSEGLSVAIKQMIGQSPESGWPCDNSKYRSAAPLLSQIWRTLRQAIEKLGFFDGLSADVRADRSEIHEWFGFCKRQLTMAYADVQIVAVHTLFYAKWSDNGVFKQWWTDSLAVQDLIKTLSGRLQELEDQTSEQLTLISAGPQIRQENSDDDEEEL